MTAPSEPDSWLKTRNLPRLGLAVAMAPPVAGALLALILGVTVFGSTIFMVPNPVAPTELVAATPAEMLVNGVKAISGGFILGALIGWPVMLVIGLPAHALLLRKTSAKIWIYITAGLTAGALAGAARLLSARGAHSSDELVQSCVIGAVTGMLAALVFWFVRRPDRDAAEYKS